MAQREGSVFIYLFVAALVLVVSMVAAVLILKADKDKVVLDLRKANNDYEKEKTNHEDRTRELMELRRLVAGSADAWPGDDFVVGKLREIEEVVNDLRSQLENTPRTYDNLLAPYKDCGDLLGALKRAWDEQALKAKTALVNHDKLRATTDEQLKRRDEDNTALQTQLSETERRAEDNDTTLRQRIEELNNQIAEQAELWTQKELDYKKELAFAKANNDRLLSRIERCEAEKIREITIEDIEPDGQILEVESRSGIAWVDLGRTKHMRPGLVFRVFQYVGGKKAWKGSLEISRVEDEYSEARILSEDDSLDPLTTNDYVTSPFYDPKVAPVFVFAGDKVTNPNVSMATMQRKLESYGAKVAREVKIDTDFLVALANYESTPEYQTARELGVTILREIDVLQYMGY